VSKKDTSQVRLINSSELDHLLHNSVILEEKDTIISGLIRIMEYKNTIFVQEKNPEDDFFIRKYSSLQAARAFVESRLETYNKMWDGCGCKIDYTA
jgi:hypothetical protein